MFFSLSHTILLTCFSIRLFNLFKLLTSVRYGSVSDRRGALEIEIVYAWTLNADDDDERTTVTTPAAENKRKKSTQRDKPHIGLQCKRFRLEKYLFVAFRSKAERENGDGIDGNETVMAKMKMKTK